MEIGLEISPSCRTLCPASTPAPIPLSLYHLSNGEGLDLEIRPLEEAQVLTNEYKIEPLKINNDF